MYACVHVCVFVLCIWHSYLFNSLGNKSSFLFYMYRIMHLRCYWYETKIYPGEVVFSKKVSVIFLLKLPCTNFFTQSVLLSLSIYCKYWQECVFPLCTHILTESESPTNVLGTLCKALNILSCEFKKWCLKSARSAQKKTQHIACKPISNQVGHERILELSVS